MKNEQFELESHVYLVGHSYVIEKLLAPLAAEIILDDNEVA
jgi:hypothetical protein